MGHSPSVDHLGKVEIVQDLDGFVVSRPPVCECANEAPRSSRIRTSTTPKSAGRARIPASPFGYDPTCLAGRSRCPIATRQSARTCRAVRIWPHPSQVVVAASCRTRAYAETSCSHQCAGSAPGQGGSAPPLSTSTSSAVAIASQYSSVVVNHSLPTAVPLERTCSAASSNM